VLRKGGYDFKPLLFGVIERLAGAVWLVAWLVLTYFWLGFVLKLFPYTRPWGVTLGGYVRDAASGLAAGFVEEIPSLLTLALIWLVTHAVSRVVRDWFSAIKAGVIEVDWCDPAAAAVSSRLAQIVLWLFALTIAYPYIPGADTPAFKGLSVLLGLMVSIGSAGVIGQIVSGIVSVYTKAIRVGDLIRVGDVEGTVTSMGVMSLKIANRFHEEFTIPNAMLAGAPVHNFSRLSAEKGLILPTAVTVGYGTPWRQVHAMLLLAAARTPEVQREPAPQVLQKALSDFYVEYTLLVSIAVPTRRPFVLSALHANIQDAFNEFGVQIMTPNFEAQPDDKIWVPRERWHESPAAPESGESAPGSSAATGRDAGGSRPGDAASTSM
jgi:small-conductance mechanosensitive channel